MAATTTLRAGDPVRVWHVKGRQWWKAVVLRCDGRCELAAPGTAARRSRKGQRSGGTCIRVLVRYSGGAYADEWVSTANLERRSPAAQAVVSAPEAVASGERAGSSGEGGGDGAGAPQPAPAARAAQAQDAHTHGPSQAAGARADDSDDGGETSQFSPAARAARTQDAHTHGQSQAAGARDDDSDDDRGETSQFSPAARAARTQDPHTHEPSQAGSRHAHERPPTRTQSPSQPPGLRTRPPTGPPWRARKHARCARFAVCGPPRLRWSLLSTHPSVHARTHARPHACTLRTRTHAHCARTRAAYTRYIRCMWASVSARVAPPPHASARERKRDNVEERTRERERTNAHAPPGTTGRREGKRRSSRLASVGPREVLPRPQLPLLRRAQGTAGSAHSSPAGAPASSLRRPCLRFGRASPRTPPPRLGPTAGDGRPGARAGSEVARDRRGGHLPGPRGPDRTP